jgi:hypothetical protein
MSAAARNAAQRAIAAAQPDTQALQPAAETPAALTAAERQRFVEVWQTILERGWVPPEPTNGALSPAEILDRAEARRQRLEELRLEWEGLVEQAGAGDAGGEGGAGGAPPEDLAALEGEQEAEERELAALEAQAAEDSARLAEMQESLALAQERLAGLEQKAAEQELATTIAAAATIGFQAQQLLLTQIALARQEALLRGHPPLQPPERRAPRTAPTAPPPAVTPPR